MDRRDPGAHGPGGPAALAYYPVIRWLRLVTPAAGVRSPGPAAGADRNGLTPGPWPLSRPAHSGLVASLTTHVPSPRAARGRGSPWH